MTKVTRWGTVISYYCYEINFCFCYFWQGWQGGLLLLFWKIFCPHYKYKYISNVSTDRCGWSSMQGCLAHSFLQLRQGDPPPPHPFYLWFYHLIKVQIFRYASWLFGQSIRHTFIFFTVSVSLNHYRATADHGMSYVFWKLWPTAFRCFHIVPGSSKLCDFIVLLQIDSNRKGIFSDVFCQVLQAKVADNNNNGNNNNNNNNNIRFYKPKLHTIRPDPYAEKPGRGM